MTMRHQADVEMNNGSDGECLSLIDDWFGSFEQELRDEGAAESWLRKARAELEQPASEGCAAAREAEKQAFRLLRDRRDGSSKHMAAVASILLALRARRCDEPREAMRAIDLAICVGGPDEPLVRLAQAIEGEVLEGQENNPPRDLHLPEREEEGDGDDEARENCSLGLVERVESMGRADFKARFYDTDTPVVLEGEALHWRAMEEWTSLNKLYRRVAHRHVPIELGSNDSWEEGFVTLGEFLAERLSADGGGEPAYLAQHPLLSQIPELWRDVEVPSQCPSEGVSETSAWLGAARTCTPLHRDSMDNFLAVLAGRKRVTLFDPSQGSLLHGAGNLSPVDVERPDYDRHPKFRRANSRVALLGPGDVLFIPAQCWHHVRNLDTTIAVNFWF